MVTTPVNGRFIYLKTGDGGVIIDTIFVIPTPSRNIMPGACPRLREIFEPGREVRLDAITPPRFLSFAVCTVEIRLSRFAIPGTIGDRS